MTGALTFYTSLTYDEGSKTQDFLEKETKPDTTENNGFLTNSSRIDKKNIEYRIRNHTDNIIRDGSMAKN